METYGRSPRRAQPPGPHELLRSAPPQNARPGGLCRAPQGTYATGGSANSHRARPRTRLLAEGTYPTPRPRRRGRARRPTNLLARDPRQRNRAPIKPTLTREGPGPRRMTRLTNKQLSTPCVPSHSRGSFGSPDPEKFDQCVSIHGSRGYGS